MYAPNPSYTGSTGPIEHAPIDPKSIFGVHNVGKILAPALETGRDIQSFWWPLAPLAGFRGLATVPAGPSLHICINPSLQDYIPVARRGDIGARDRRSS